MATLTAQNSYFLESFDRRERDWQAEDPAWLFPLRKAGIARFAALGFPTTRDEAWRYTNVSHLAETEFQPAERQAREVRRSELEERVWSDPDTHRVVLVNGVYEPGLSDLTDLGDGVRVMSLRDALRADGEALKEHLARHADHQAYPLVGLNAAFLQAGVFVHVRRNTVLDRPIHVIHMLTGEKQTLVSQPRTLVVAEESSSCSVVESYRDADRGAYFTNAVTEIIAGDNARVAYYKMVHEGEGATHVGHLHTHQERDAVIQAHAINLGDGLARNEFHAVLNGPGADCTLTGLYMPRASQHVDNHLRVEHAAPHCDSRENFKGILDDRARGVFTGRIVVHKEAQKTDGKQSNMNLLLSDDAQVETKPQLEIFADDVKCTHGATIGQIDEEAIFYLRSRGIPEDAARGLLVYAFAGELLDEIGIESLRRYVRAAVVERLPHAELFREIG